MGGVATAIGGGGFAFGSALWFIRWLCEFIAKRADVHAGSLATREAALGAALNSRLQHLEAELSRTRRAVSLLMQDIAKNNPGSPVLHRAAELLMPHSIDGPLTNPVDEPDEEMNEALRRIK